MRYSRIVPNDSLARHTPITTCFRSMSYCQHPILLPCKAESLHCSGQYTRLKATKSGMDASLLHMTSVSTLRT